MAGIQQLLIASFAPSPSLDSWEHFAKDALAVNNNINDEKKAYKYKENIKSDERKWDAKRYRFETGWLVHEG